MQKVLITGHTGFVGTNLIAYNERTDQFRSVLLSRESMATQSSINSSFEAIDSVIHLAGKAHDLNNKSQREDYYIANFELTRNLYDAFLCSTAQKFIFISSVKAVADNLNGILSEDYPPDPKTHYGKSKLQAEQYIQNQILPKGKSYYILRPCMIHGPGNKGNLNLLYKLISRGIPYPLASFENKRSFLSVENLCFVIQELLLRKDIPSGVYNVADDEALSTIELIRLIAGASDKKPLLWKIRPGLIRSLAKLGDFLKLPLTTERLNKLTENYIVDNTKIRQAFEKEFPIQARDGIIKTIRSFKSNKNNIIP